MLQCITVQFFTKVACFDSLSATELCLTFWCRLETHEGGGPETTFNLKKDANILIGRHSAGRPWKKFLVLKKCQTLLFQSMLQKLMFPRNLESLPARFAWTLNIQVNAALAISANFLLQLQLQISSSSPSTSSRQQVSSCQTTVAPLLEVSNLDFEVVYAIETVESWYDTITFKTSTNTLVEYGLLDSV